MGRPKCSFDNWLEQVYVCARHWVEVVIARTGLHQRSATTVVGLGGDPTGANLTEIDGQRQAEFQCLSPGQLSGPTSRDSAAPLSQSPSSHTSKVYVPCGGSDFVFEAGRGMDVALCQVGVLGQVSDFLFLFYSSSQGPRIDFAAPAMVERPTICGGV